MPEFSLTDRIVSIVLYDKRPTTLYRFFSIGFSSLNPLRKTFCPIILNLSRQSRQRPCDPTLSRTEPGHWRFKYLGQITSSSPSLHTCFLEVTYLGDSINDISTPHRSETRPGSINLSSDTHASTSYPYYTRDCETISYLTSASERPLVQQSTSTVHL